MQASFRWLNGTLIVLGAAIPLAFVTAPTELFADDSLWSDFKRIRQGDADLDGVQSEREAPPSPEPAQSTPNPATAPGTSTTRPTATASNPGGHAPPTVARASKPADPGKPDPAVVSAPDEPTETGNTWAFFRGDMAIADNNYYDDHGIDFEWAYAIRQPLQNDPRIVVHMHGSGGGKGSVQWAFAPSRQGDIEIRAQDAETYSGDWREWWTFGHNGLPYPGRRIAAALEFVTARYDADVTQRGIILQGTSMGGVGSVIQTMVLPDPWRSRIAWASGRIGALMPRRIGAKSPGQYATLPPDIPQNQALWDTVDFSLQAARDPVVRGIHYRHAFSTDDQFTVGPDGNTQLELVNIVEKNRIGGAFSWVKGGHSLTDPGTRLPDLSIFEAPEQDVTLDRAHPAITRSTGNYPMTAAARVDENRFPRGHYNMGITWDHAGIVDQANLLVFPLRYRHRTGIGNGVPDQAREITISVTPRRTRHFNLRDGETVHWQWAAGALSGTATVSGDTLTIDGIPLVSGDDYRRLRITRAPLEPPS